MRELHLHLRDRNEGTVEAWNAVFSDLPRVTISHGNILDGRADAIISPANSFGFMDGGVDLAYSYFFGWSLQERLQSLIHTEYDHEVPVGQALVLPTLNDEIPFLISAP